MKLSTALAASALATLSLLACSASNDGPTGTSRQAIVPANPTFLGWESLSGDFASNPVIVSTRDQLGVYATNWGEVFEQWNNGIGWVPAGGAWRNLGNNGHAFNSVAAVAFNGYVELFAVDSVTGHLMHQEGGPPPGGPFGPPTWNSNGWEDLGGNLTVATPTVAISQPGNQMNVFGTVASTHAIAYIRGTNYGVFGPWSTDGIFASSSSPSAPAAVSWGTNRVDVFVRGTDNQLYHRGSADNGATWYPPPGANPAWENLGGSVGTTPLALSWGPNRIDLIVAQPTTGAIYHLDYDGTAWGSWLPVSGGSTWQDALDGIAVPAAITTGPGSIQIFMQGTNRGLYTTSMTGTDAQGNPTWNAWTGPLAGCFIGGGSPSVTSMNDGNALELAVTGAPDVNSHRGVWHESTWKLPPGPASPPACPSGGINQPCLDDNVCNAGEACWRQMCIACGGNTDPVCTSGSPCVPWAQAVNGVCLACGESGQAPCSSAGCAPGLVSANPDYGAVVAQVCVSACGNVGQLPCTNGPTGKDNSGAQRGGCTAWDVAIDPESHLCEWDPTCGHAGQGCCDAGSYFQIPNATTDLCHDGSTCSYSGNPGFGSWQCAFGAGGGGSSGGGACSGGGAVQAFPVCCDCDGEDASLTEQVCTAAEALTSANDSYPGCYCQIEECPQLRSGRTKSRGAKSD